MDAAGTQQDGHRGAFAGGFGGGKDAFGLFRESAHGLHIDVVAENSSAIVRSRPETYSSVQGRDSIPASKSPDRFPTARSVPRVPGTGFDLRFVATLRQPPLS